MTTRFEAKRAELLKNGYAVTEIKKTEDGLYRCFYSIENDGEYQYVEIKGGDYKRYKARGE